MCPDTCPFYYCRERGDLYQPKRRKKEELSRGREQAGPPNTKLVEMFVGTLQASCRILSQILHCKDVGLPDLEEVADFISNPQARDG